MNFQYPFFADSSFKIHIKNETKFVIDGENPILSKTKKPKEELVCIFFRKNQNLVGGPFVQKEFGLSFEEFAKTEEEQI